MNRPPRLKVASVYGYLCTGGDESRLIQYLAARDTSRFDHIVVSAQEPNASSLELNGPVYRRIEDLGVEIVTLGLPCDHEERLVSPGPGLAARQARDFGLAIHRLRRLLVTRGIDIVDARISMGALLGAFAGRAAGARAIVSTNYELTRFAPPGWRQLGQAAYALTDALVCDSQANLDEMRAWMHAPPPGICVPNGIARPQPSRPPAELRAELGIPADAIVIGQVARIQPHKGQDLLLEAAPAILARHPRAFFLLCGYRQLARPYQERLDQLVAEAGIGARVRIVSWPGPIGDIWSTIDLHAHPTRRDSSPIALLESMSLGIPAITTQIGGIAELVAHEETGLVLPPDDLAALTGALLHLLDHPDEARRLGEAARARYEARHRPEIMARATEQVFDAVWAQPRLSTRQ